MSFLKRLGRAIGDILTSKKAIATGIGIIATAAGQPQVGAMIASYVVGQGIADHGKEAAKKKLHSDQELADKLRQVREGKVAGSAGAEP